jgi:hypothetical protein
LWFIINLLKMLTNYSCSCRHHFVYTICLSDAAFLLFAVFTFCWAKLNHRMQLSPPKKKCKLFIATYYLRIISLCSQHII